MSTPRYAFDEMARQEAEAEDRIYQWAMDYLDDTEASNPVPPVPVIEPAPRPFLIYVGGAIFALVCFALSVWCEVC